LLIENGTLRCGLERSRRHLIPKSHLINCFRWNISLAHSNFHTLNRSITFDGLALVIVTRCMVQSVAILGVERFRWRICLHFNQRRWGKVRLMLLASIARLRDSGGLFNLLVVKQVVFMLHLFFSSMVDRVVKVLLVSCQIGKSWSKL